SLRLLTEESSSELVGTEIVCSADGLYCVSGVYRNEPRFQVRDRSEIHYGAVWLRIIDEPVKKVMGHYWTDRETAGEVELDNRQVAIPPWSGQAAVGPFKKGRIAGFTIAPTGGLPPILLLTTTAEPSDDCTHALKLRGAKPDLSAPGLDLTSAKWIKHPEPLP